ncbi:MAG: fibronectin type III domain-containing protein [Acidobacteria bacterium]|nr:MAG: fibronectin type III domain-containing protein [Acidobacteriota bacterium]
MKNHRIWLAAILAAALTMPAAWAIQLDDKAIFIEINDTDGDAGIQLFLDGEGWEFMSLRDPDGKLIFSVTARGSIAMQGVTELFFESAEPSFDEQPLDELLALFPEGEYRFIGRTTDNVPLRGKALLTHALPGAPVIVLPVEGDEDVDPDNAVIQWQPVADPPGSKIISYEVVVEKDEGALRVFKADLGPAATTVTVPPEFLQDATLYTVEVIAKESSGNQTISERPFATEGGSIPDDDEEDAADDEEDG